MKKYFLIQVFIIISTICYGQDLTINEIKKVANVFYSQHNGGLDLEYNNIIPLEKNEDTLLFVFEINEGGFILVSNCRSSPPILGYTKKGDFDLSVMPPGLIYLLEKFQYSISVLKERSLKASENIENQWN